MNAPLVGYCVVCKTNRPMRDTKEVERMGAPAIEGSCTICGSKIFILGAGTTVPLPGWPPS